MRTASIDRVSYRLAFREGRPVIVSSTGEVIPPSTYCDCITWKTEDWIARNRDFVESGVHLYFLSPKHDWNTMASAYWTDDGVYPAPPTDGSVFDVEEQAQAILKMDPQARFYVRPGEAVPRSWQAKHRGEMQLSSTGQQMDQISLASEIGWEHFVRYLKHCIAWCESRPWADRIVGYMYFAHGEGLTGLACNGFTFDVSEAMQRAFRQHVRAKYATDDALRKAWNDPAITLDGVAVPTEADWKAKRERLLHWPKPEEVQRERDYFELQAVLFRRYFRAIMGALREATAQRPVLLGIDALKQPMIGWLLNQAFGRQDWITEPMNDFPEMTAPSGALDVGDLLDDDGWQIVITPSDYTARSVGYAWESEGVNDSLRLRGKVMLVENDARTWMGAESETLGAFLTPAEVRAGLLRNTAWALTRGHLHYWMNVGSSYFHDPKIHEAAIRDERRLLDASVKWPHRETEHAICLVIDDSGPLHENGTAGYQQIAALWQRHLGLAHCGVPYRVYLFSDLAKPNMPAYRTYLFPNLFELNDERLARLRRTVLRDGRVAIFGPATGITDGQRLGADKISQLLGVEFELVPKQAPRRVMVHGTHPITHSLPAATTFGDSFPYGPVLVPTRAAVNAGGFVTLGSATTFWNINKPGLILKEFGQGALGNATPGDRGANDYAIVWTVALPLPANLLRECARYAGSHIWCEDDAVVLASDTVAALHTVKNGPHTLHLPSERPVWDLLSGKKLADDATEIELQMTAPETRLFYFGNNDPFEP
jgi:hypothetical protein